jgi:hypothetical protein
MNTKGNKKEKKNRSKPFDRSRFYGQYRHGLKIAAIINLCY